ncbi:PPOX class probable F420-dependent enzyme [Friedmanniella endophytica]|uniref:PPOX class probable F420-dependent enzyme n=1 Tax=Microlunatus kandeliicorticis TaxID=1759536 RepID=A0A7W3ISH8_9ACTN|nr:pyridoxamine 5'-phosphate oxidase family protein [Microlunatus kandeliicorticis]MBA8794421.1 PPOX class probable F420-dependent enzyme [Microlunatus kandeliicorticis]
MPTRWADADCVWVAVNRADGPPHVTPVWFVEHDESVWFTTPAATTKAKLLRADARVSLAVEGSAGSDGAVAEGTASLLSPADRPAVIAAFAAKYHGWDASDPHPWGERLLVRVDVTRWLLGP